MIPRFSRNRIFPTVLNVTGLTLAFSVFMILSVQVAYDTGYDLNYPDAGRIVRMEYSDPTSPGIYSVHLSRPVIEYVKSNIPEAEAVSCYNYYKGSQISMVEEGSDGSGITLRIAASDFDLLNVFPFSIVEGDTSAFHAPMTAIISEKGARKLFGESSPVGKAVREDYPGSNPYRIVAVYRDFPDNSSVDNEIIVNLGNTNMEDWSEWSFTCYMKLVSRDVSSETLDQIKSLMYGESMSEGADVRFVPLHDAYFEKDVRSDNMAKGNLTSTIALMSISVLVLVIAIINFINLAMASTQFTIKGINTRRVLGSTRSREIARQLAGALVLVLVSFALSVAVMSVVATSSFASYVSGSLKVADNIPVLLTGLGVAVLTAIVSGILPARYSTSFNPALVLKGSFSLSASGRRLRTVLVGFQYMVSFVLILCALFITVQIRYMKGHDMGFDRDNVLEFYVSDRIGESRETLKQMLMDDPDIEDVTFAGNSLVSMSTMGWGRAYQGERVQMDCIPVDRNFISFFGMSISQGRDFNETDDLNPAGTFIVNEAFMEKYPFLRVGLKFTGHQSDDMPAEIVGVVRNFNYLPLQYGISPLVLYDFGSDPWWPLTVGYARVNPAKAKEAADFIRSKCQELDPTFDVSNMGLGFMDEGIGRLYESEDHLNRLITTAALISLLISIVGILGLVYFETQFRRKEIALRRVHGAQVNEILLMINRYYLIITAFCFAVAVPVSVCIMRMWVSGFTYQSRIPVWIFLGALLSVSIVTTVTVTLECRRTALLNPAESLRNE